MIGKSYSFVPTVPLRNPFRPSTTHIHIRPRRYLSLTHASVPPPGTSNIKEMSVPRTPSTDLSREAACALVADSSKGATEQVDAIAALSVQQSINCCGVTSVSYALSALGFPTSVDDIFLSVGINVESAVGDGMTLAEIHDASARYVHVKSLPVFVECYHFDAFSATRPGFKSAVAAEADAGTDDLTIINFHSGIAHGWETGGGGHFSVLIGPDPASEDLIIADVHGVKYGEFWSAPREQIFDAMVDKDSCGRSRGAIRFGRTDRNVDRPLPGLSQTLVDWTSPPAPLKTDHLKRYVPKNWDDGLGVKNMEGVSALSAAIRVLDGPGSPVARLDGIMRSLQESYCFHLDNFLSVEKVRDMAAALHKKGDIKANCTLHTLEDCSGAGLGALLSDVGCGKHDVAVLVRYNVNTAYGDALVKKSSGEAGALEHGVRSWSLIAAVNPGLAADQNGGIIISPAHNVILTGRLWPTSMDRMAAAIKEMSGTDQCSIVVLDKRGA